MSARPFQVGDRVRITGWGSGGPVEITIDQIDPADPDGRFGPYIVGRGLGGAFGTCSMNYDVTGVESDDRHAVELLDPAPTAIPAPVALVDPDDPTSMALPVVGDTVLLHDGRTGRVADRDMRRDKWAVKLHDHGDNLDGATILVSIDEIVGYPEDDGTEDESLAEVQAPLEIVADQYWIDKRLDRRHQVWAVIDGMVEMNGPTGNAYAISPADLRDGYTLEVSGPAPDMEWVLGDEGEPIGVREVSTDPVGALTGEPHAPRGAA